MPDPGPLVPLAHAGHWLVWVLYAAPVIAVLVAIVVGAMRERRRDRDRLGRGGGDPGAQADEPDRDTTDSGPDAGRQARGVGGSPGAG